MDQGEIRINTNCFVPNNVYYKYILNSNFVFNRYDKQKKKIIINSCNTKSSFLFFFFGYSVHR